MNDDQRAGRWRRATIGVLVGASAWLSAGTLAVIDASAVTRLGTLPDLRWLLAAVGAGVAAAVLVPLPSASLRAPVAARAAVVAVGAAAGAGALPAVGGTARGRRLDHRGWRAAVAQPAPAAARVHALAGAAPGPGDRRCAGGSRLRGVLDDGASARAGRRRAALSGHRAEPALRRGSADREQPPAGPVPGLLRRRAPPRLHAARRRPPDLLRFMLPESPPWCCRPLPPSAIRGRWRR